LRSYPWRSEARRSSIHGPQRAGPQPDDTAVCTPAIGLAGRYRIGPSPVRNAFTPTNQGDAHLSSHRQLASRAAPVGAYKNREHRYLGIEVDDALAIAEQVDVWLPWQSRPALPLQEAAGPKRKSRCVIQSLHRPWIAVAPIANTTLQVSSNRCLAQKKWPQHRPGGMMMLGPPDRL